MTSRFPDGLRVGSSFTIEPSATVSGLNAASLDEESLQAFAVPFTSLRVWDNLSSVLPATPAADDLGLIDNTFGTGSPTVETGDLKAAGATTRYARFAVPIPREYSGGDVVLRINAQMKTTVADTTATVDVEAYEYAESLGSDLISTAAQSINSLTSANVDFVVTAGALDSGDMLDVRIAVAVNDGATGTAVIGKINNITLLCDTRG